MQKRKLLFVSILLFSLTFSALPPNHVKAQTSGDISFQPNIIPFLTITERMGKNNESFRFSWLENSFDLELFFNATLKGETRLWSLRDFEVDFNVTVDFPVVKSEGVVRFGWNISDVSELSDSVHGAWVKVEDSSFDVEEIMVEEIEQYELGYNMTRYNLPDNLSLDFEDLRDKGFILGWQNNTATEVKGFKGKSSWNLDPITYSTPVITVIGGSQGSPLNFKDIWDADQAGGWNVVHNNNETNIQYEFQARIVLGNGTVEGTTYFNDTNVEIWSDPDIFSANYQNFITVNSYAYLQFGVPNDISQKTSSEGIMLYHSLHPYSAAYEWLLGLRSVYVLTNGAASLYSCKFFGNRTGAWQSEISTYGGDLTVWQGIYENVRFFPQTGGSTDLFDVTLAEGSVLNPYTTTTLTMDKITVYDAYRAILFWYVRPFNISNVYQRGYTGEVIRTQAITVDFHMIDCDLQVWSIVWGGTNTGKIYRDYTFNLKVQNATSPIQNANVTLYDNAGTKLWSQLTDANGNIETKIVTRGYYNQTGGNTMYESGPHTLIVTYQTYTYTQTSTLTAKTDWVIALTAYETADETTYITQGIFIGGILSILLCAAFFFVWVRWH